MSSRISWDLKLKTTDHQCSVPLGLSGKTVNRSRSFSGMCRMAPRFIMPSRSCGPYAVGKNFSKIIGDTICIFVSPPDAEMCSLSS